MRNYLWFSFAILLQIGPVQSNEPDIVLKTEITPENPYVQAQFLYILRVSSEKRIVLDEFPPLKIKDAHVHKIGDMTKTYKDNAQVLEQAYAIFSDHSGLLEIPSITIKGIIHNYPPGSIDAVFYPPELIERHFPAQKLEIQAKPPQFPNNERWLPAQNVSLNEVWNTTAFSVQEIGKTVTLTLSLQATGLKTTQLPKLALPNLNGIKVYSKQSVQYDEHLEKNGFFSKQVQQIDLVPNQPGNYTLPEIRIPWWDTVNQQLRYAVLPARSISVAGTTSRIDKISIDLWQWLSIVLMGLWLITLIVWWKQRQNGFTPQRTDKKEQSPNISAVRKQLKRACEQNAPQTAQQALLEWATICWAEVPMHNLGNLVAQLNDKEVKNKLRELDIVLYAPQEQAWDGKAFWGVVSKKMGKFTKDKVKNSPLPRLYPETL